MENQDKLYDQYKEAARKAEEKGFGRMEAVWSRVEEKLDEKKEHRGIAWWKYSGVAAMLILFIAVDTFIFRESDNVTTPNAVPGSNVTIVDTAKIKATGEAVKIGVWEEVADVETKGFIDNANAGNESAKKTVVARSADIIQKIKIETSGNGIYTGFVTDETGLPVPGVNVIISGTQVATSTDFDGKFQLPANKGDVFEISFVGYKSQRIKAADSESLNVVIAPESQILEQVVVDAYRSTTVAKSASAVTTIDADDLKSNSAKIGKSTVDMLAKESAKIPPAALSIQDIEDRANTSVLQNLQGQVAGLNIATGSGQPGADSTIILRGTGTINGNIEPLFIIDGVPVDEDAFRTINRNDIEAIRVLKDAAATSIYGNRGANGVIVITTKDSKSTKSKLRKQARVAKKQARLQKQENKVLESVPFRTSEPTQQVFDKVQVDQEEYEHFIENQFENPATTPLSTFSIDVDNASYTNIRRFLNNGQVVPKDAVRVEEMINFFKYQYPQPKGNEPFSINTEYSDAPWNPKHKLLRIGLQGKQIPTSKLLASNFVFLIDVSGSMNADNKLPLLKQSMKMLVNQMRKEDRIAIVVYAGAAGLVLPSTSGSEKDIIIAALENLNAGGSTAGGAGIELAYKTAQGNFVKGGNNRVILATDGDFNVGASSNTDMQTLIEEKRKSGVFLTCLGYGMGNYKDSKLETLADKGNGNYAYIDNMQEADRFLQKEFKGSMYAIAKDVKIQIEFNPKHVQSYRLIGYENRKLHDEDFANDAIDAGELGSGHTVTALYEIIPVGVKSDFFTSTPELKYSTPQTTTGNYNDELATIKFRHKKPDEDVSKEIVQVIPNTSVPLQKATADFKFSASVAWFGLKLRDSKLVPNKETKAINDLAREGLVNDNEGYKSEFVRLVNMVQ